MQRLGTVEWRLRVAAGNMCPRMSSATGAIFDDADAYSASDRPLLREAWGMGDLPLVAAVAPGSPAEAAGLREGDELMAIGTVPTKDIRAAPGPSPLMVEKLEARLGALPAGAPTRFTIRRDGATMDLDVVPRQVCSARFMLKTDGVMDAYSDGQNLAVTAKMVAFTRNDDELALLTGHELGHIVARDDKASGISMRRAMERRADALSVPLAYCAGYDVPLALDFWRRFNQRDWLRWARAPTHPSVSKRLAAMGAQALPTHCPINTVPPLSS